MHWQMSHHLQYSLASTNTDDHHKLACNTLCIIALLCCDLLQCPHEPHTKSGLVHGLRHTCAKFHQPQACIIAQQLTDSLHYGSPVGDIVSVYNQWCLSCCEKFCNLDKLIGTASTLKSCASGSSSSKL
jgi:hypothetical protein